MSLLSKIGSALGGSLVKDLGAIAGEYIQSADEKAAFELKAQEIVSARMAEHEETTRSIVSARMNVMVAEMQHGDTYTKRARPTLAYFGMAVIFFNYCLVPLATAAGQPLELPAEFWAAWAGVVGIWSLGRSAERVGKQSKLTQAVTGSKGEEL